MDFQNHKLLQKEAFGQVKTRMDTLQKRMDMQAQELTKLGSQLSAAEFFVERVQPVLIGAKVQQVLTPFVQNPGQLEAVKGLSTLSNCSFSEDISDRVNGLLRGRAFITELPKIVEDESKQAYRSLTN